MIMHLNSIFRRHAELRPCLSGPCTAGRDGTQGDPPTNTIDYEK